MTVTASPIVGIFPPRIDYLILESVAAFRDELSDLRFLPESRYDRSVFPSLGQYDWLSGQVLYCLVRATRPRKLVEFSTSSGYSTTFSALAMQRNGVGALHTVDLDARALDSAERWLRGRGLGDVVQLYHGDCRDIVPRLVSDDLDLLFIDTLHSFEITEWYLSDVVPRLRDDCLVHIHDVMPPEARVRIHGGPPYPPTSPRGRPTLSHLIKRFVWLLLHARWPNPMPAQPPRETFPLERLTVFPPVERGQLPTIDGNYFEEALVIRELLRDAPAADAVYLHRLEPRVPGVNAQKYAPLDRIQRQDARGEPLEWNDVLWCRASTLKEAALRHDPRRFVKRFRRLSR